MVLFAGSLSLRGVRGGAEVTSVASRNFATLLVTLPIVRMGKRELEL